MDNAQVDDAGAAKYVLICSLNTDRPWIWKDDYEQGLGAVAWQAERIKRFVQTAAIKAMGS